MKRVGTAGWTIPANSRAHFASEGTQLERYASQCNCVEINSSFYRAHRSQTYARWAASVPPTFAFSLKIPKEITHARRCVDCEDEFARFVEETSALGERRAVLLIQLPPSFAYDKVHMDSFLIMLRARYDGLAVCEPRHPSWFTQTADAMLREYCIGRVAADPALSPDAAAPGGWPGIVYYRNHGSPRMYYSRYESHAIAALAGRLADCSAPECWAIFDNTGAGAALENALELSQSL